MDDHLKESSRAALYSDAVVSLVFYQAMLIFFLMKFEWAISDVKRLRDSIASPEYVVLHDNVVMPIVLRHQGHCRGVFRYII